MRGRLFPLLIALIVPLAVLSVAALAPQAPQQAPPPQMPPPTPPVGPQLAPPPPQPPRPSLNVVVLDPGHGGTDAGARGPNGVLESEVVLMYAHAIRTELERQGVRVILTRQGGENPSFDDRSAMANAQHGAVFISLHVSSGGSAGTARVYSLPLTDLLTGAVVADRPPLVSWDEAQRAHLPASRRLAELVSIQLAQKFRGSPEVPVYAAVRQLRTVAAPAIAIEVASVAVPNADALNQMAPALAQGIARAVADFRPLYEAGAK